MITKLINEGGPEINNPHYKVIRAVKRVLILGNLYYLSNRDLNITRLIREDINSHR